MAFLPDGKTIITTGNPGKIRFFNADDGKELRSFSMPAVGGSTTVPALTVTTDGKSVIVPGLMAGLNPKRSQLLDQGLVILDAMTAKPRSFLPAGNVKVLAVTDDGKKIAVATGDSGDPVVIHDMISEVKVKP